MKIDTHVIFLIVIIGIITAGIAGATVLSNDSSMKQIDLDGIKVSVPSSSEFVKIGDGVYKDDNNGIQINVFKDNNSMVDFLKNTKNSKIIPVENQPPQSVAFEEGDNINILVTNGKEGVSVSSKDGALTAKIANNIVFSNNHKSEKSSGLQLVKPRMTVDQDFNLIQLIIADVDTDIFNIAIFETNIPIIIDEYNEEIDLNNITISSDEPQGTSDVSNVTPDEELNNVLNEVNDNAAQDNVGADDNSASDVISTDAAQDNVGADDNSAAGNPGFDSTNANQEMSYGECFNSAQNLLINNPELTIDEENVQNVTDGYIFPVVDGTNNMIGEITVNYLTGEVDASDGLKAML